MTPSKPVGRTPLNPLRKKSQYVRCLVTPVVKDFVEGELSRLHGLNESDLIRLALYNLIKKDRAMTPEIEKDPTWDELKEAGLI
jgi:hypothetical protein